MVVQHKKSGDEGMFYVQVDGAVLAKLTYLQQDTTTIIISHTEVDDELRGKNVGYQMVANAVQHARNNKLKIVPQCPFVKSVFDKKQDYNDVLQQRG